MSDSVRPHRRQSTRLLHSWDSPGKNTGVGCRFLLQCMKVKSESEVARSCLTLSDPMDCSPPGSSVHGIFQEWGAIVFSVYMCYIFFIHSSLCLGCCHIMAIVNTAAVNMTLHVSFWMIIVSGYICPGVVLVDHMLVLLESYILFSIVAVPIYIPSNSVGRFPFSSTLCSSYSL